MTRLGKLGRLERLVRTVLPRKSGFLPGFISKVGSRKPLGRKALRVFCPLSHFFLLFNAKKKH
uniref:Uncharacterized protein n=1 Tax=Siphoviridae sp. ctb1k4 TaxID=2826391 RepID=A0A8S5MUA7_9CAUD|nr:MAG TPA: hypothetical protein [Siphoviridae sp. ctb1k4]